MSPFSLMPYDYQQMAAWQPQRGLLSWGGLQRQPMRPMAYQNMSQMPSQGLFPGTGGIFQGGMPNLGQNANWWDANKGGIGQGLLSYGLQGFLR
ncbi:hypothetical protein [Lysobacter sp. GCM10012299]|uniref:hypothetical protein n=1 Tax=Lysobacter sp. GCM10012299 TaxID=3317333 RepID=UPI003616778B